MMMRYLFLAIVLAASSWQGVSSLPMNITDDVYTIYRDGVTPTPIPRVDIATGKLLEVLVQINEASAQGFVFTDTHVYIPFREHIRGQFAYSNAVTGDYHAGILNQFVGPQKDNGRLGVDPVVLTAEKWHTLHYEGSWDQVTPPPPLQDEAVVELAREIAVERHATVLAQGFASGIGADLTKGAQDGNVITDVFDYATTTPDHRDNHQNDIDALRQKLERSNIPERRQDPSNIVHNFVGCHHLERMDGLVSWSEDEEGAWIPLDQPVVSFSGLASHIPAKYSSSIGTTVYMYDEETDTLEYYWNHNSLYENHQAQIKADNIYGPDLLPAALYVSPADGDSRPLAPPNGRSKNESGPSLAAEALWNKLKTMPIDYTYFDRPTCPDSIRAGVDASLKNFDSNLLFETTDPAVLAAFVAETVVPILTQAVACTSHFNRDGYSKQSPFAFTEDIAFIPFAHGLLEIQPDDRLAFLSEAGLDDLLIGSERCSARSEVRCSFERKSRKNTKKSKKRKKKKHSKKGKKEVERDKRLREEEPTIAFSEGNNCEQKTECLPCLVHRCFYGREDDIDEVCSKTCPFTKEVCGQGALCGYPPDIKGSFYCIEDIENGCL